jgi:maltooligosyltrehalose trehalohydrolase
VYNERLGHLVSLEGLKLAAGLVLLHPSIPLLFMGEEYNEKALFPYFISHSDPGLVEAVRKGRKEEFAAFAWKGDPADPQDEQTFLSAQLDHERRFHGDHKVLYLFYREVISLRKELRSRCGVSPQGFEIGTLESEFILWIRYGTGAGQAFVVFNVGTDRWTGPVSVPNGMWSVRLHSAEERWHGHESSNGNDLESHGEAVLNLPGFSFVVLTKPSCPD